MKFTIQHPIRRRINEKKSFIEFIIHNIPYIYKKWQEEEDESALQMAKEEAGGDEDVQHSMYRQFSEHIYYNEESFDSIFYPSLFLTTFSYFASFVGCLAKETNTKKSKGTDKCFVDDICDKNNINLSAEAQTALKWINTDIKELRNDITHNNEDTQKRMSIIKKLCQEYDEISFSEFSISISGSNFILELLGKEYLVLSELCDKLGYTSKHYSTGQQ